MEYIDMDGFFYQIDELFREKKTADAEQLMKDYLDKAEELCDSGAIISICNELGSFYRTVSRYDDSISLYEKALEIIRSLGLEGSEHHGTTLINYAAVQTIAGNTEKALKLSTQAADIFSGDGYAMDYRLATLYNNISFLCQDLGEYESAEEYLNNALYILNILEDSEVEIAITYTNMANIYLTLGRLDEAKLSVKKALDGFIKETDGMDINYSAAVSTLANIYFKEENYEKAAALFEKALELVKRDYGSDNENYNTLLENLNECRALLG